MATLLYCLGLVVLRLVLVCDGDPGCFTVAGATFTDPRESGLPVLVGPGTDGYDGQFFWRLARSPDRLELEPVHGVRLDSAIRVGRPGYPVLAWLAGLGGRADITDWSLIVVNLVGAGILAGMLANVAQRAGRSPWFGVAAVLWPGLLFALARDLSEVTAATFVVGGLFLLDRRKPALAALAWSAAVLVREQSLVVPLAYGLVLLYRLVRGRARTTELLVSVAPAVGFVGWQAVARADIGQFPLLASAGGNSALPLTAFLPAVADWASGQDGPVGLLWIAELAVLAAVAAAAASRVVRRWEVVAIALGVLLLLSASDSVWRGPAHLRYATDLAMLSWFVLLREPRGAKSGDERWLRWLALSQAAVAIGATTYLVRTH